MCFTRKDSSEETVRSDLLNYQWNMKSMRMIPTNGNMGLNWWKLNVNYKNIFDEISDRDMRDLQRYLREKVFVELFD